MSSEKKRSRVRYWVPCTATAANICCGFASIFLAAEGRFDLAVYALAGAIILDTIDGRLARLLHATSDFGKQFDSFSDSLSFGVAPAFLVQRAVLAPLGAVSYIVATIFVLGVVFRLSRFNLTADTHTKARRTTGLPCPIGASYLMAAALMRGQFDPLWGVVVVLIMSLLFLTRWHLPDLKGKSLVSVMLLVGLLNYVAVIVFPCWGTIIWWNVWNALILLAAHVEDRRLARQGT